MPSSDLPTSSTDKVAAPTDEVTVTGHDSPAVDSDTSAGPTLDKPELGSETTPDSTEPAEPKAEPAEPKAELAETRAEPADAKLEPAETKAEPVAATTSVPTAAPVAEPAEVPAAATTPLPAAAAAPPASKPPLQPSTKPAPRPQPAAIPTRSAGAKVAVAIGLVVLLGAAAAGIFLIAADSGSTPTAQPSAAASSDPAASPSPAATSAAAAVPTTGDIAKVKVTGTDKPTVTVPAPFAVAKTSTRVLTAGTGKELAVGESVTIDYLGVNGTSGKTFDTSFGKTDPVSFVVGDKNLIKGMMDGLTGVKVGSRVLLAIPAADGYGTKGAPDAGIGPNDTLLFLIDVKSATKPLTRAAGTAVAPKAGLPTVKLDSATGAPTITVPKSAAPTALVVQPLIKGTGKTVAKGQSITVNYTGAVWATGKVFDSSWTNGAPATFSIGTGAVIPGWDKGLVGQKVGSQVLLSIPPADGYGATGQASAGISGTDTLVFVVDILAAS